MPDDDRRVAALEQRVDRFETRVERELANGSRTFARREVVDRVEREIKSDIGDLSKDLADVAGEISTIRREQRDQFRAIRNIVTAAIISAILSGLVSLGIWAATS